MKTKAQLEAEIVQLNEQLLAQGKELDALRLQLAVHAGPSIYVDKSKRRWHLRVAPDGRVAYMMEGTHKPTVQQRLLPAHFAAAREAAMRNGHSVRVCTE